MAWLAPLDPVDGRRRYGLRCPADGRDLGAFTAASTEDVQAAVDRARTVQQEWARTPVRHRQQLMARALQHFLAERERFVEVIRGETGRSELDTLMMEVFAACDCMHYYGRRAHKVLKDRTVGLHLLRMKKARLVVRPLGIIGIITPWNGPFILSLNPTVQAVLGGNAVVIKPSEVTPRSAGLVQELFEAAGFPEGLVQVIPGDGETGAALIEAGVDKVSFTGSVRTGRRVGEACGRNLVPVNLELGGKDPAIVCADADLERAAGGVLFGGVMNAGQFCSGTERVYVVEAVAEDFLGRLTEKARKLEAGRDYGPMIHRPQLDILREQLADAVDKGARVLTGGGDDGRYFEPTVLTEVTHDMLLMTEETFGPILPVMVVADEEEALRLANDTRFGLGAAVWTKDTAKGEQLARRLDAGSVMINESSMTYGALELPFGGRRESGVGTTNGAEGILNFCQRLPILTDRFGQREEAVWYPYTADKLEKLSKAVDVMWGSPLRWLL